VTHRTPCEAHRINEEVVAALSPRTERRCTSGKGEDLGEPLCTG